MTRHWFVLFLWLFLYEFILGSYVFLIAIKICYGSVFPTFHFLWKISELRFFKSEKLNYAMFNYGFKDFWEACERSRKRFNMRRCKNYLVAYYVLRSRYINFCNFHQILIRFGSTDSFWSKTPSIEWCLQLKAINTAESIKINLKDGWTESRMIILFESIRNESWTLILWITDQAKIFCAV